MNKQGLVLVGLGVGALIGALLSKTKVGEEINEKLCEAFDKFKDDVMPVCEKLIGNMNNEIIEG